MNPDRRAEIEMFFVAHRHGVGSYASARTGNQDVAESITGRVFLSVVRHWEQCRGNRTAWLWGIVRNEVARHFRDSRDVCGIEDVADRSHLPDEEAELAESRRQLRYALEQLTEAQREIVYLKFFEQMRNREIAEATGQSPQNIGVIVHRALNRLRALMHPSNSSV